MRTFFGIKVEDCLDDLIQVQTDLKLKDPQANYTLPNNIHLTLAFLGEINSFQLKEIKKICEAFNYPAFNITIDKIKNLRDMIIGEVLPTTELLELQKLLQQKLIDGNFRIENRRYYPHITLCRRTNLNVYTPTCLTSKVKEILFFSSERNNSILQYNSIYRFPLN